MTTQDSGSLITDEMRQAIGVESEPGTIAIEKETIRRLADALGDNNPLYRDEEFGKRTKWDGMIAFPLALHPNNRAGKPRVSYKPTTGGGSLAGDEWEIFEPMRPGDVITVTSKIADFTERDGPRKVLLTTNEVTYKNQHGRVVMVSRRTSLGFAPRPQA